MEFITNISPQEHDEFVQKHPLCNLLQSSRWAQVKHNWDHDIVGIKENGKLVASALVLIKRLPLSLRVLYTPRGPIMDYENDELVHFFFAHMKQYARKHHAVFLSFDPAIHCNDYPIEQANEKRRESAYRIIHRLRKENAQFKGFTKAIADTIQPRYHANVYACDQFKEQLPKSAKKALHIAEKKLLEVEYRDASAVADFAAIMHHTEERKHIALRGADYFQRLMDAYQDDAVIVLVWIPLNKLYEKSCEKLAETQAALAQCPENAKKKRFTLEEQQASYLRETEELQAHRKECGDRVIAAGALCVKFGATAELLYAGMDDTYKRYMAPYLSFYSCMEWSFAHGCTSCNMGGVEGDLNGGLTKFKANFKPVINEYIGEFTIPYHKLMYQAAMSLLAKRKKG